jgi:CRP/FNR family transcriptional regulator, cyclic AMP receptor protein
MAATLSPPVLEQILKVLEKVPLFEGLSRRDLEHIAKLVRGRTLQQGELLFKEGDAGDKFYILQSGSVEVVKQKAGGEVDRLAIKRAGEALGEMALLTAAPRSATVRALEATNLLVVSRDQFEELLGGDTLALRVMRSLAKALRALNIRFGARDAGGAANPLTSYSRAVQLSLLPKQTPDVPGFEIAAALARDDEGNAQALWEAVPFRGGGVVFAVLDAKGPGLPPAHLLGLTRALLHEIAGTETKFERLLPRLNDAIHKNMVHGADVYIEVSMLHLAGGAATFSVAGEEPAIVVRAGGRVDEIAQHGPALGVVMNFDYGATRAELGAGDVAVLFSESDHGLLLGAADLIKGRQKEPVRTLAAHLYAALMRAEHYRKGDDISFVIARKL